MQVILALPWLFLLLPRLFVQVRDGTTVTDCPNLTPIRAAAVASMRSWMISPKSKSFAVTCYDCLLQLHLLLRAGILKQTVVVMPRKGGKDQPTQEERRRFASRENESVTPLHLCTQYAKKRHGKQAWPQIRQPSRQAGGWTIQAVLTVLTVLTADLLLVLL